MAINKEKLEAGYMALVSALADYEENIDAFITENETELKSFRPLVMRSTASALRSIIAVRDAVEIMTGEE